MNLSEKLAAADGTDPPPQSPPSDDAFPPRHRREGDAGSPLDGVERRAWGHCSGISSEGTSPATGL